MWQVLAFCLGFSFIQISSWGSRHLGYAGVWTPDRSNDIVMLFFFKDSCFQYRLIYLFTCAVLNKFIRKHILLFSCCVSHRIHSDTKGRKNKAEAFSSVKGWVGLLEVRWVFRWCLVLRRFSSWCLIDIRFSTEQWTVSNVTRTSSSVTL